MPSRNIDHQVAQFRGRVAGYSASRSAGDPALIKAKAELAEAKLADYIRRTVQAAPPLTAEQRCRLAVLLMAASSGDAA